MQQCMRLEWKSIHISTTLLYNIDVHAFAFIAKLYFFFFFLRSYFLIANYFLGEDQDLVFQFGSKLNGQLIIYYPK